MTDRIEGAPTPEEWNNMLGRSPPATPFHLAERLRTCAEYTDTRCHLYIGYKGQEPTGVFPIFELQKGPITAVFSPPPNLKIPYLEPALVMPEGMKQRKCERWTRSFVEAVVEHVETEIRPVSRRDRAPRHRRHDGDEPSRRTRSGRRRRIGPEGGFR